MATLKSWIEMRREVGRTKARHLNQTQIYVLSHICYVPTFKRKNISVLCLSFLGYPVVLRQNTDYPILHHKDEKCILYSRYKCINYKILSLFQIRDYKSLRFYSERF